MPTTLTPVDEHTANVIVPNDTEPANALSVRGAFIALDNRTHNHLLRIEPMEDAVEDLEFVVDLHEGRLDSIEAGLAPNFSSTSTGIASNLVNISSVTEIKVRAALRNGLWIGTVYAIVVNSGAGFKSFRVALNISDVVALDDTHDACGVGAAAFSYIVQVSGIVGQKQILLTWESDDDTDSVTLRAHFSYKNGVP